jgi:capsid protein
MIAPYLHEYQKFDDARIAELEAMVLNAMLAWWVKPGADAPSSDILKAIKNKAGGGTAPGGGGNPGAPSQNGSTLTSQKPGLTAPPLQKGESLESFATARPNLDVAEFTKRVEGDINGAEGMAPEMVDIKYDTAYTAARGAILTTWTRIEIYRDMTASQWLGFILEAWFVQEIAAGRVKAKGFGDSPLIRRAWLNCTWLGTNMPSVNPLQEVQAIKMRTELGHTTGKREAMKYNNSDFGDNTTVLKDENEDLAEARAPIAALDNGQMTLGLDESPAVDPRTDPASPEYDPNFKPAAPGAMRNVTPLRGAK